MNNNKAFPFCVHPTAYWEVSQLYVSFIKKNENYGILKDDDTIEPWWLPRTTFMPPPPPSLFYLQAFKALMVCEIWSATIVSISQPFSDSEQDIL